MANFALFSNIIPWIPGNVRSPRIVPGPTNLANAGAVLSPFSQFTPYPRLPMISSIPSYRPPSPLAGRSFQPIQQPPNIMRPIYPRPPVTRNMPFYRPPQSLNIGPIMRPLPGYPRLPVVRNIPSYRPLGANVRPIQSPPNIMGPVLGSLPVYPRLPIAMHMPSYRPPSVTVGRNIRPIYNPSNVVRLPSYYNRIIPWKGRTVTFPQRFPIYPPRSTGTRIPVPNFNPLPQLPVNTGSRYPYPQIGQAPSPYRPVLNLQLWKPQYSGGLAMPISG